MCKNPTKIKILFIFVTFFLTLLVSHEESLLTSNLHSNDVINSSSINSLNSNIPENNISENNNINTTTTTTTQLQPINQGGLPVPTAVSTSLANLDNSSRFIVPNQPTARIIGQKSSHSQANHNQNVSGYDTNSSNAGSENSPPQNKFIKYGNNNNNIPFNPNQQHQK